MEKFKESLPPQKEQKESDPLNVLKNTLLDLLELERERLERYGKKLLEEKNIKEKKEGERPETEQPLKRVEGLHALEKQWLEEDIKRVEQDEKETIERLQNLYKKISKMPPEYRRRANSTLDDLFDMEEERLYMREIERLKQKKEELLEKKKILEESLSKEK